MKSITLLLSICACGSVLGQPAMKGRVSLSATQTQSALVQPGSISTPMVFIGDPASNGGDVFDISVQDPSAAVSIIRPDGTVITTANANTFGYTFGIIPDAGLGSLPLASFGTSGTHSIITLGPSQLAGNYTIQVDGTTLGAATLMLAN